MSYVGACFEKVQVEAIVLAECRDSAVLWQSRSSAGRFILSLTSLILSMLRGQFILWVVEAVESECGLTVTDTEGCAIPQFGVAREQLNVAVGLVV